jgi:hypothetical protein
MAQAGVSCGFLDASPRYAGLLYSVSNTIATIPGIVSPTITQAILYPDGDDALPAPASQWRIVFYVAGALNLASLVVYLFLAKAYPVPKLN